MKELLNMTNNLNPNLITYKDFYKNRENYKEQLKFFDKWSLRASVSKIFGSKTFFNYYYMKDNEHINIDLNIIKKIDESDLDDRKKLFFNNSIIKIKGCNIDDLITLALNNNFYDSSDLLIKLMKDNQFLANHYFYKLINIRNKNNDRDLNSYFLLSKYIASEEKTSSKTFKEFCKFNDHILPMVNESFDLTLKWPKIDIRLRKIFENNSLGSYSSKVLVKVKEKLDILKRSDWELLLNAEVSKNSSKNEQLLEEIINNNSKVDAPDWDGKELSENLLKVLLKTMSLETQKINDKFNYLVDFGKTLDETTENKRIVKNMLEDKDLTCKETFAIHFCLARPKKWVNASYSDSAYLFNKYYSNLETRRGFLNLICYIVYEDNKILPSYTALSELDNKTFLLPGAVSINFIERKDSDRKITQEHSNLRKLFNY